MRQVKTESLTIPQANEELSVEMDVGFWEALVRLIAYPELVFDATTSTIRFPNYVPFRQLASEWIEGIEQGIHDIRICEGCSGYFDIDRSQGIFGRHEEEDEFICRPCAEAMSALTYYERFILRRG